MLEKLISTSRTIFISLFLSGSAALFTTYGCDPLEEEKKLEDSYNPKCSGDVSNITLSQLEQQLVGGYSKINRKSGGGFSREKHPSAKISVKIESDPKGFQQPIFNFQDTGDILDKVYVTNIDEVKGMLFKSEDGKVSPQVWFSYSEPIGVNLPAFKRSYFTLEAGEEWKGAAEALCTLSRHYRREKIDSERKKNATSKETVPEKPEKDYPLRLYLTRTEQEAISKTETLSGKNVELLTQLQFENCVYSPEESTNGLKELSQKIKSLDSSKEGALVIVGNATIPSAEGCQLEMLEYNNFQLSFDRANTTAAYIERSFPEQMGYLTMNVWPNSTNLDERTVRVYYVINQSGVSK